MRSIAANQVVRITIAALLLIFAEFTSNSDAATVRGQVLVQVPPGATVPKPQALVEMFPLGYSGPAPYQTTTGPDGFYYFQQVAPGSYQIWINRSVGPYVVQVGSVPNQDVAPILTR